MKMKLIRIVMLTTALMMVWGCSSNDDDPIIPTPPADVPVNSTLTPAEKPAWKVDLAGNDAPPTWEKPDPAKYESSMFVLVKLQDELVPYSTSSDLMSVFIGDECRTLPCGPDTLNEADIYFLLKVDGGNIDRDVVFELRYYCASLRQTFVLAGKETFAAEYDYGFMEEDFVPPLLKGCKKYPVQNDLMVSLPQEKPFTPSEDDLVAVFVGDECRGVGSIGKKFTVFRTSSTETLQLRYYSAQQEGVYTFTQSVEMPEKEDGAVTLKF